MKTMQIYKYDRHEKIGHSITIPEISCTIAVNPVDYVIASIPHGERIINNSNSFEDYSQIFPISIESDDLDFDDYRPSGLEIIEMETELLFNNIEDESPRCIIFDNYIKEYYGEYYSKYPIALVGVDFRKLHKMKYENKFQYQFKDIIFQTDDKRLYIPKIDTKIFPDLIKIGSSIAVLHKSKLCNMPGTRKENIWICGNLFPAPVLEKAPMTKDMIDKYDNLWKNIDRDFGHIRFTDINAEDEF